MYNKIIIYTALGVLCVSQSVFAQANYNFNKPANESAVELLRGYILDVPAGVATSAVLSQEINSNTAVVGQTVNAILTEDFTHNNQIIAPAGSIVSGSVVLNKRKYKEKNVKMQIRFTTITTPYNNVIPISALIEEKGEKILVPANSEINIKFDQPITLGAR